MSFDNETLTLLHDGPSDVMTVTILGSLRSLPAGPSRACHACQDSSQQTATNTMMIDREVPTRDLDTLTKYSKNFDVRYFRNIKDRLRNKYWCTPHHCQMIKERLEQHQEQCRKNHNTTALHMSNHEPDNKNFTTATSPIVSRQCFVSPGQVHSGDGRHSLGVTLPRSHDTSPSPSRRSSTMLNVIQPDTNLSPTTNISIDHAAEKITACPSTSTYARYTDYDKTGGTTAAGIPMSTHGQSALNGFDTNGSLRNDRSSQNDNSDRALNNRDKVASCKSDSKISLKRSKRDQSERKNGIKHNLQKEVEQWLRDVPMYSVLGREEKDRNANEINKLIKTLVELSTEDATLEQEHNFRKTIVNCLNSLPISYSEADGERKTEIIENLIIRIKKVLARRQHKKSNTSALNHSCLNITNVYDCKTLDKRGIRDLVIEWLWLINLKTRNNTGLTNNMSKIADFVIYRISPLLKKSLNRKKHKNILINTIIDVLEDLPININCPRYKNVHFQKFAEDLFNRLQYNQIMCEVRTKDAYIEVSPVLSNKNCETVLSEIILNDTEVGLEVSKCVREADLECHANADVQMVYKEIEAIVENLTDIPSTNEQYNARNKITQLLIRSMNISEAQASYLAKKIIKNIYFDEGSTNTITSQTSTLPQLTRTTSVYMSDEHFSKFNYPITSTPKKKPMQKSAPNINIKEKEYIEKVTMLIRAWMDTLPESFSDPEIKDFKETIIQDLAGDIMDEYKVAQLTSNTEDRQKYLKYIVYRWIHRLEEININDVIPQIDDFLNKLNDIPVPVLTRPCGGNRQEIANIKHIKGEYGWEEDFLPKGIDILEDEISIWINQQSPDIFQNKGQCCRQKKVHELAQTLQSKLANKRPPTEISKDIALWLNNMVTLPDQQDIVYLAEDLKDKVIGLPKDATLATNLAIKIKGREEITTSSAPQTVNETSIEEAKQENTMKIFIDKFIEHNCDLDDPMARIAANQLLKLHLKRLSSPIRADLYNNLDSNDVAAFPSPQVMRELEYIKDVSDWLSNIPIDVAYNSVGNRERVDFVTNLAASIRDVEEERENNPDAMDYDLYMAGIISQFMNLLPIPKEYIDSKSVTFMIDQLLTKIIVHRESVSNKIELNESINTTGINTDNIGDFVEEFIRVYGDDIAENELKLEIWALRLIREIKRMLRETLNPSTVTKAQCCMGMKNVPLPGDETVHLFTVELEYIEEISNWMKNLPLLPINESEEYDRGRIICELAEKIIEMDSKKTENSHDTEKIDDEFKTFLTQWICQLSLDNSKTIVFPVVIEQLLKRIEKVKKNKIGPSDYPSQVTTETSISPTRKKKSKISLMVSKCGYESNSGKLIIDIIDKWSQALPIEAENETVSKELKEDISVKLIQKVGELNMDANIFYNDRLYQNMLNTEVHKIIDNIPQYCLCQIQSNRNNLEADIVNDIIEARNIIKENTAGEAYRMKLENTIVVSMPEPSKNNQFYDPGFEIYKTRLATIFILENFDHSIDEVKIKYENNIKKEIDKYFEHAQNKNSVPLSKDEIYNELYSALYKVPIPNENSIINEVEELKTRCEVDAWFEMLPLREPDGVSELLFWDKILSTLAKRIHDLEKTEPNPDQKIKKEIMKCLAKLPLLLGKQNSLEKFAETLEKILKNSEIQRKCVLSSKKPKGKKDKGKNKLKGMPKPQHEESQIESSRPIMRVTSIQLQKTEPSTSHKKAGDVILDLVQTWCDKIPLCLERASAPTIRDRLVTKIMIKINELNSDPAVLNVDTLYDRLLDDELEKLLSTEQTCANFEKSKDDWKHQLKEGIKSIKPLIKEEIARYKYKENLNKIVDQFMKKPQIITQEEEAVFIELKADVIDNFIQYKSAYNQEEKLNFKLNIEEKICKYMTDVLQNKERDKNKNILVKTNQLMCELSKISAHNVDLTRDIEEIRMNNEVAIFFDGLSFNKTTDKLKLNQSKAILANKLNDISKSGYNAENEIKMHQEISKCLSKLKKDAKPQTVAAFINRLKNTKADRRPSTSQLNFNYTNNISSYPQNSQCCTDPKTRQEALSVSSTSDINVAPNRRSTSQLNTNYINNTLSYPRNFECCTIPKSHHEASPVLSTPDVNFEPRLSKNYYVALESRATQARSYCDMEYYRCHEEQPAESYFEDVSKSCSEKIQVDNCEAMKKIRCRCRRRSTRGRHRPYCMVPMKWYCDRCDGYNPLLCRVPLAGFF